MRTGNCNKPPHQRYQEAVQYEPVSLRQHLPRPDASVPKCRILKVKYLPKSGSSLAETSDAEQAKPEPNHLVVVPESTTARLATSHFQKARRHMKGVDTAPMLFGTRVKVLEDDFRVLS